MECSRRNGAEQARARGFGTNTQFSGQPPDQGFCIGSGFAVETVNTAVAVFSPDTGARLGGPTPLSQLFPPPPCLDLGGGNPLCEARWGDYRVAEVDAGGSIWLATLVALHYTTYVRW